MNTYEIRENTCVGPLLTTIEADSVEAAASKGAASEPVRKRFGGCFGVNRETGTPGKSGVFSLRRQGNNKGQIHVCEAAS